MGCFSCCSTFYCASCTCYCCWGQIRLKIISMLGLSFLLPPYFMMVSCRYEWKKMSKNSINQINYSEFLKDVFLPFIISEVIHHFHFRGIETIRIEINHFLDESSDWLELLRFLTMFLFRFQRHVLGSLLFLTYLLLLHLLKGMWIVMRGLRFPVMRGRFFRGNLLFIIWIRKELVDEAVLDSLDFNIPLHFSLLQFLSLPLLNLPSKNFL